MKHAIVYFLAILSLLGSLPLRSAIFSEEEEQNGEDALKRLLDDQDLDRFFS